MITLTTKITQVEISQDGVSQKTVVTDTLYVFEARFDFSTKAIYVTIQRGTQDAYGVFVENFPALHVTVNPDGSFVSDGQYSGPAGSLNTTQMVADLAAELDKLITDYMATQPPAAPAP